MLTANGSSTKIAASIAFFICCSGEYRRDRRCTSSRFVHRAVENRRKRHRKLPLDFAAANRAEKLTEFQDRRTIERQDRAASPTEIDKARGQPPVNPNIAVQRPRYSELQSAGAPFCGRHAIQAQQCQQRRTIFGV